jgi:hypothetical protein
MLQVRDWFRRKASKDPLQRRDLPLRYEISEFYYNLINLMELLDIFLLCL